MLQLVNIMRSEAAEVPKAAKVFHDTETLEYVVRFYIGDTHLGESDYFTDEKSDAVGTASAFVAPSRARAATHPL